MLVGDRLLLVVVITRVFMLPTASSAKESKEIRRGGCVCVCVKRKVQRCSWRVGGENRFRYVLGGIMN